MRPTTRLLLIALALPPFASAQDGPLKVEPLKEAPPSALAGPVKDALATTGFRVVDGEGKPFFDLWLRKGVPASGKPSGPMGTVLYPVLGEGELLGVVRYVAEGYDYRDQAITPGVYTLRYGLQPVNGDHLGVSENRDYGLLVPSDQDKAIEPLPTKTLHTKSAEAAGTSHPAILMMLAPPADADTKGPSLSHDEAKRLWGVVLPLTLAVKGGAQSALPIQLVIVGAAPQ